VEGLVRKGNLGNCCFCHCIPVRTISGAIGIATDVKCVMLCWSVLECVGVCCSVLKCVVELGATAAHCNTL